MLSVHLFMHVHMHVYLFVWSFACLLIYLPVCSFLAFLLNLCYVDCLAHTASVNSLSFHASGDYLITGSNDSTMKVCFLEFFHYQTYMWTNNMTYVMCSHNNQARCTCLVLLAMPF